MSQEGQRDSCPWKKKPNTYLKWAINSMIWNCKPFTPSLNQVS